MKNMTVYDLQGKVLFTGTRHDAKKFVRANKINRYRMKETFVEKVVVADPVITSTTVDENPDVVPTTTTAPEENFLAQPDTKEGFFNKVFK